jgi:hypothetical protein
VKVHDFYERTGSDNYFNVERVEMCSELMLWQEQVLEDPVLRIFNTQAKNLLSVAARRGLAENLQQIIGFFKIIFYKDVNDGLVYLVEAVLNKWEPRDC